MRVIQWFLLVSLILIGCSSQTSRTEESTIVNGSDLAQESQYVNNPQAVDDRSLTKVGQTIEDQDGELTLKAIHTRGKVNHIGPIKFVIREAKVLNYYPSPDLVDFFHAYTDHETNFNYVKLEVTINNTGDQPVNFSPVTVLETNEGEKKRTEDDFYLEDLNGIYRPGEKKTGDLGFVVDRTKLEELESVNLKTSDVIDISENAISNGEKIKVSLLQK